MFIVVSHFRLFFVQFLPRSHDEVGRLAVLVGNQVVMRVTVIGDKGATLVIAGNLEHVGVDFTHGGLVGLAVDLNCDGVMGESSGCELSVNLGVHLNVTTMDIEFHTVGAKGLGVV